MSQPDPYVPSTSFVSYQAQQSWFPGQQLDAEFNNLEEVIGEIETNLALIQRDDGALINGVVTFDSLAPSLQSLITFPPVTGVTPASPIAHNWVQYIDSSGLQHVAQPAFTDISGALGAGQLPAPFYVVAGDVGVGTETNPQAPFVYSQNSTTGIVGPSGSVVMQIGATGTAFATNNLGYGSAGALQFVRADGSPASPTSVGSGETIGAIQFGGWNGAAPGWQPNTARIRGVTVDTFSNSAFGTGIVVETTPSGSTTRAQATRTLAGFIVGSGTTDPGRNNFLVTPQIVSALPSPTGLSGAKAVVTDATAVSPGSIAVGGGSNVVGVFCNGANWIIEAAANFIGQGARVNFGGTNATFTPPNPNAYWRLPFSTVELNEGAYWDTVNFKWTPPTGVKKVLLQASVFVDSGWASTNGNLVVKWIKNTGVNGSGFQTSGGTELQAGLGTDAVVNGASGSGTASAICIDNPSPGDYYQPFLFADTTSLGSTLVTVDGQHAHTYANFVILA